jgi:transcriptional regulator with XRE-family HTH domain
MSTPHPEDAALLFFWLWSLRDWSDEEVAAIAGVDLQAIERYEEGAEPPSETALERLTAAVGLPIPFVYAVLAPTFRLAREMTRGLRPAPSENSEALAARVGSEIGEAARLSILAFLSDTETTARVDERPSPVRRLRPKRRREESTAVDPALLREQRGLHERMQAFWEWALEDLEDEPEEEEAAPAAPEPTNLAEAEAALETARADHIAMLRMQGYATAFATNAQRVVTILSRAVDLLHLVGDLKDAREPEVLALEEKRFLEIDAAIRDGQKRFEEAIDMLDKAALTKRRAAAAAEAEPQVN